MRFAKRKSASRAFFHFPRKFFPFKNIPYSASRLLLVLEALFWRPAHLRLGPTGDLRAPTRGLTGGRSAITCTSPQGAEPEDDDRFRISET